MKRTDYNTIAAVVRQAILDGNAKPALAMRFAEVFIRRGDKPPDFLTEDFINRAVPEQPREKFPKINPGKTFVVPEATPVRTQVEEDASLFTAILMADFPELSSSVRCAYVPKLETLFTIGTVGGRVYIRFGAQAAADPVAAVRQAAPDAAAMAKGQSAAREIIGR